MSDLVTIDRGALQDLITAVNILTLLIQDSHKTKTTEDLENENTKLRYANKLILTSMQSYEKHNQ